MNVSKYMNKFGKTVYLDSGGSTSTSFSAFIQPLRYKNKMYLYGINTPIGFNSQGHCLYIGPPEYDLTVNYEDICIHVGTEKYQIDRAEKVCRGNETFYIWAIIRTIVEEQEGEE